MKAIMRHHKTHWTNTTYNCQSKSTSYQTIQWTSWHTDTWQTKQWNGSTQKTGRSQHTSHINTILECYITGLLMKQQP